MIDPLGQAWRPIILVNNLGCVIRGGTNKEQFSIIAQTITCCYRRSKVCSTGDDRLPIAGKDRMKYGLDKIIEHQLQQHRADSKCLCITERLIQQGMQLWTLKV